MPPRSLASLATALAATRSIDAALLVLAEALGEIDRGAEIGLVLFDGRREMLTSRLLAADGAVDEAQIDTTLGHLPSKERSRVTAGLDLVDFGEGSDDVAALLHLPGLGEPGWLGLRGLVFDGTLSAILAVYEGRRLFGTRAAERLAPALALFELTFLRQMEAGARAEAVEALQSITRTIHDSYERRLADLRAELEAMPSEATDPAAIAVIASLEEQISSLSDEARRATRRADAVDATVSSAVAELEKAHIELHSRSEQLRQKSKTLYLIDRLLTAAGTNDNPRELAEAVLDLVAEDMQAQRCSLMLRTPDGRSLFLAAATGIAPGVSDRVLTPIGEGVAGGVAASRMPLLVQDSTFTREHALRLDEYFTSGSFISFPLVHRGELVGVVNLANRVMGSFAEEDVDRVRTLGLVIALVASNAGLAKQLYQLRK